MAETETIETIDLESIIKIARKVNVWRRDGASIIVGNVENAIVKLDKDVDQDIYHLTVGTVECANAISKSVSHRFGQEHVQDVKAIYTAGISFSAKSDDPGRKAEAIRYLRSLSQ